MADILLMLAIVAAVASTWAAVAVTVILWRANAPRTRDIAALRGTLMSRLGADRPGRTLLRRRLEQRAARRAERGNNA